MSDTILEQPRPKIADDEPDVTVDSHGSENEEDDNGDEGADENTNAGDGHSREQISIGRPNCVEIADESGEPTLHIV